MPSSSKSSEDCSQSSSYKSINSSSSDKMSRASPQHAVEDNSNNASSKLVQSENQCQNASTKEFNSKITLENKIQPDNNEQTISTLQSTYSPPINSQQIHCTTDTNNQTTATLELPKSETTKNIDLSTLSTVLDDGKNKEEKSTVLSNDLIEEKSKSNSDHRPQNTSNLHQNE